MDSETLLNSQRFRVERLKYNTQTGEEMTKDVVRHPGSVAIVPVLDDGQVCLIRNRRVTVNETLLEIPAGTMEPPEPPEACAYRELTEETGFRANKMELLATFFPAPGILDERMFLYLATGLQPGEHAREKGEEIENEIIPLDHAIRLVETGEIHDAKTMLGLMFLQRKKSK